jgi:(p)ppGpp synthase/HD superfamily hydrolase
MTDLPAFLDELPLARRALSYAAGKHEGQLRDSDAAPFILHPLEVARLLHEADHADAVVAAGILHDTVEDTDASTGDIEARFGREVACLVAAMTEDPSIESYEERKAALRRQIAEHGADAAAVYAADKVAKARELRDQRERDPRVPVDASKVDHYRESLRMLDSEAPDHPLVARLREELAAL